MADTLTVSSTYLWKLTATKDGVAWNLTGATVTLLLRRPDGTTATKTATVVNAAGGVAEYTGLTTDLDVSGSWTRTWRVVQSNIDVRSVPQRFLVKDTP